MMNPDYRFTTRLRAICPANTKPLAAAKPGEIRTSPR
jgi:hypothetical protein